MIREIEHRAWNGLVAALLLFAATLAIPVRMMRAIQAGEEGLVVLGALVFTLVVFGWLGLFVVQPNQGKVLQFFGRYVGTVRKPGLWWANPFYTKKEISLRVRNFETAKLKVNDHSSNPIEIGAVVVWQVTDTAEAMFEVDSYENYVKVQSEAALRALANQ